MDHEDIVSSHMSLEDNHLHILGNTTDEELILSPSTKNVDSRAPIWEEREHSPFYKMLDPEPPSTSTHRPDTPIDYLPTTKIVESKSYSSGIPDHHHSNGISNGVHSNGDYPNTHSNGHSHGSSEKRSKLRSFKKRNVHKRNLSLSLELEHERDYQLTVTTASSNKRNNALMATEYSMHSADDIHNSHPQRPDRSYSTSQSHSHFSHYHTDSEQEHEEKEPQLTPSDTPGGPLHTEAGGSILGPHTAPTPGGTPIGTPMGIAGGTPIGIAGGTTPGGTPISFLGGRSPSASTSLSRPKPPPPPRLQFHHSDLAPDRSAHLLPQTVDDKRQRSASHKITSTSPPLKPLDGKSPYHPREVSKSSSELGTKGSLDDPNLQHDDVMPEVNRNGINGIQSLRSTKSESKKRQKGNKLRSKSIKDLQHGHTIQHSSTIGLNDENKRRKSKHLEKRQKRNHARAKTSNFSLSSTDTDSDFSTDNEKLSDFTVRKVR